MSQSFSASGGFFGVDPTATVGASVTFGLSVTRSIPDISINNRSISTDGQNASWTLAVASQALAQHASMEFTTQMLFRVPTRPGGNKHGLKLEFNCVAFDDDHNGTAYHDRTQDAMRPNLGKVVLQDWGDRGMTCIEPPAIVARQVCLGVALRPACPSIWFISITPVHLNNSRSSLRCIRRTRSRYACYLRQLQLHHSYLSNSQII
ncbi:hypothetical protein XH88_05425 [Bradyrhizobium sp. CCBAU 51627]|nr:hypothetical protein [Bradyrhizobium sp. CCBAU 51627]